MCAWICHRLRKLQFSTPHTALNQTKALTCLLSAYSWFLLFITINARCRSSSFSKYFVKTFSIFDLILDSRIPFFEKKLNSCVKAVWILMEIRTVVAISWSNFTIYVRSSMAKYLRLKLDGSVCLISVLISLFQSSSEFLNVLQYPWGKRLNGFTVDVLQCGNTPTQPWLAYIQPGRYHSLITFFLDVLNVKSSSCRIKLSIAIQIIFFQLSICILMYWFVFQISHLYSDGDWCELTNKKRRVEVKLKCKKSDSPSAVSLYLLEPKTCE